MPTTGIWEETDGVSFQAVCRQMPKCSWVRRQSLDRFLLRELRIYLFHRIPDFFTDNYDHPIYEAGKQLKDMVYLKRSMDE